MLDFVTGLRKVAAYNIEGNVGAGMPQVRFVIRRNAADVHGHFFVVKRQKLAGFAGKRVIYFYHGFFFGSTETVAIAAMPSPRPIKPSFSLVVAFIPTRSGAMPMAAAITCFMRGVYGFILGCSAITAMSTLFI